MIVLRKASELHPGDKVLLEGDVWADPDDKHPEFADFQTVEAVEIEGRLIAVYFATICVGWPPDHEVRVES